MYNKPKIPVAHKSTLKGYPESKRICRPLRYYVAGGADVDGDAKAQDKNYSEDPDADADNWQTTVYGSNPDGTPRVFADPFGDPRHDVFSITDMTNISDVQKVVQQVKSNESPETKESE